MRLAILLLAAASAAQPALAAPSDCRASCAVRLTPQQLLAAAERLVLARKFDEVRPLLAALRMAPGFAMQSRFLSGMIAAETRDYSGAAEHFKAILAEDPRQTRVRLELGKTLLAMRRPASADRHFRIAAQDQDLPPEVARTIRTVRDTIRASRAWRLDVNYGIAPDSNVNNATAAQTVNVLLGGTPVPLTLDERAKAKSGVGHLGQVSAGLRLPVAESMSLISEVDAVGTDYDASTFDDYLVQAAAGAEYRLTQTASVSLQGVGAQRWFGQRVASRQFGARAGAQAVLGRADRLGLQLDVRRTTSLFDRAFSGWQTGLYGTYEHAIARTVVVSAGPFVRRDSLNEDAFSSTEVGGSVGIGGELRYGINFGASLGVSRARFDAPLAIFDLKARRDDRVVARATLGNRKLRVLGLSPQLNWTYTKVDSSLDLYGTTRSRFELTLARYF